MIERLRNIAIIAHVDHGKTTLVDKLLQQSGTLGDRAGDIERVMDSNDLEKERGITILSKNTAIQWNEYRINIVDTPGHADFGGEVERVMSMVDCVLLLVDAVDGPMPQTRFVTQKAFAAGLKPIVVINKIDRPGARPDWVMDQVFDLFDNLGATDEQLDFPVIYASALNGIAGLEADNMADDMTPLLQTIVDKVDYPNVDADGPFQMQISSLDYNSYLGIVGIGRVKRGNIKANSPVKVIGADGNVRNGKILTIMGYHGLERVDAPTASAGEIVCITGLDPLNISDTLCDPASVEALPPLSVDEPTVSMFFHVEAELKHNVALRVEETGSADQFRVSGRGELHLSVLIENMRREGFELAVGRPQVIIREEDGVKQEPYETVIADVEEQHQGAIMEHLGLRRAEMTNMEPDGKGRVRLEFLVPSRGLIGFRSQFLTLTSGTGILNSTFSHYGEYKAGDMAKRINGVLVSMVKGKVLGFALFNLQERGRMLIDPNVDVYEGQIIGIHSRGNDLVVNPTKGKQLTNMRASGTDENIVLTPPIRFSLEQALDFIEDDELVEVTPNCLRIRKKLLTETERKRAGR